MALLGISITYDRVLELETDLSIQMCKQFEADSIVCPSNLRTGIFTVGALDNIDHNLSSTTAHGSFHGTGISIMQFPTKVNAGVTRETLPFQHSSETRHVLLPESYTVVPAVAKLNQTICVPEASQKDITGHVTDALDQEEQWIDHSIELLPSDELVKGHAISWAAYHASQQAITDEPPVITSMLPIFTDKADTPAMVEHGLDIVKNVTEHLNPGQIPVLACDCPIFAICKNIQWTYPDVYGEDRLVVMFGGLHLEKGLWNVLGDLLEGSGWTASLTEASVATSGVADACLRAAHITRTRHCHQVTALALSKLQRDAYTDANISDCSLEAWKSDMSKQSPTFQFWDIILRTEILIMLFIRSHRQNAFHLYVECLDKLMFLFFALDHYNYSRWVSVHVRDMKSLSVDIEDELARFWVVRKSEKRFSSIPIDQAHEQENCKVKGSGGIIGMTENPTLLQRWLVAGPEQSRLLEEFENEYVRVEDRDERNRQHHEEGLASQRTFQKDVNNLVKTIDDYGNPFAEKCPELIVLNTRDCAKANVVNTVRQIEEVGKERYETFKSEVFVERSKPINGVIKKNMMPLFRTVQRKVNPKAQQIAALNNDVNLFGRMYIANQQRDGDPAEFFSHENQLYPPSLSDHGTLHLGTKSDLLKFLDTSEPENIRQAFDAKIIDGATLVHTVSSAQFETFNEYVEDGFIPVLSRELRNSTRVDVVWDTYLDASVKGSTRSKRGSGARVKVAKQTKIPRKWNDFLREPKNKEELFDLISDKVAEKEFPCGKEVFITKGVTVIVKGTDNTMGECSHEEADTRVMVHVVHALECGASTVMVRTVDTDIVVILIGHYFTLIEAYSDMDLWVAFGVGKNFRYYNINYVACALGEDIATSLPIFHAYTGCDTTSAFFGKGKKSAWEAWKCYPDVTTAFLYMHNHPFAPVDSASHHFAVLERFTVVMYDKTSTLEKVNDARKELFAKRSSGLGALPPTQDALLLHVKRTVYQGGIWSTCRDEKPDIPTPDEWGWMLSDSVWRPVWMTLPEASKVCMELIKCSCKAAAGCTRCKCAKSSLPCTDLCLCKCEK